MKLFEKRCISISQNKSSISPDLGNQIQKLRKNMKLNQAEFGQLFSPPASKGIVSKWEHGITVPSPDRLTVISEYSGKSVETLLYGSLRGAIISVIDEADSYIDEVHNSKTQESFVLASNSSSLKDINFRRHIYDFITYSDNDSFGTKHPAVWKKLSKNSDYKPTPEDDAEESKFFRDEYIASRRYFLNALLPVAKATDVKPYQRSIIMTMLANAAEDHFRDVTRTDNGVIAILKSGVEDIDQKLSSLTTAGTSKGIVELPNNINPSLLNRVDDFLQLMDNEINKIQEKYVPNYYHKFKD